MTALANFKLIAAQKPKQTTPIQQRRDKMVKRIWEQMELAKAQQQGSTYAPVKLRSYTDKTSGERVQVETRKRVKAWWFTADNGRLALSVRYGARVLELAKGKWAVDVGTDKELLPVLEALKQAVLAGELDAQLQAAAKTLREGFDI